MRILAAILFLSGTFLIAQNPDSRIDRLIVYKHERRLVLRSGEKDVQSYKIALGGEPVGPKTRQGDHRTPEGNYLLDGRNPNSHYYKAFHIYYPSSKDVATAKKLVVSPGGYIMLHGLPKEYAWLGKTQSLHDWTDGCIAVSNQEMDEIWNRIKNRT